MEPPGLLQSQLSNTLGWFHNMGHVLMNHLGPDARNPYDDDMDYVSIGSTKKSKLVEKFKNCLLLVFDERSMLTSNVLGKAESTISKVAFEGRGCQNHSWAGTPVVLVGAVLGSAFVLGLVAFIVIRNKRQPSNSGIVQKEIVRNPPTSTSSTAVNVV